MRLPLLDENSEHININEVKKMIEYSVRTWNKYL